jgi:hypothetical protein
MLKHDRLARYIFTVYDPAAPGLPWLSVCIGPDGRVMGAEAFDTLEDAQARTAECAEKFLGHIESGGTQQVVRTTRLH